MYARSVLALVALSACSSSRHSHPHALADARPAPTADASNVPRDPEGTFHVVSTFDLATAPPAAEPLLHALADATDDPDDPARYLVDQMIAALPEGAPRALADELAPWLADAVQRELAEVAPKFADGARMIVVGLERYAHRFDTLEVLHVNRRGGAMRTVIGFRFALAKGAVDALLADDGSPDLGASTRATLDASGTLTIAEHQLPLRYGTLLRLALERAVLPSVTPDAHGLGAALRELVDCAKLGAIVADQLGGTPAVYETACTAGLDTAAADFYAKLHALDDTPSAMEVAGTARGIDRDGDGKMDEIVDGQWSGTLDRVVVVEAPFVGTK